MSDIKPRLLFDNVVQYRSLTHGSDEQPVRVVIHDKEGAETQYYVHPSLHHRNTVEFFRAHPRILDADVARDYPWDVMGSTGSVALGQFFALIHKGPSPPMTRMFLARIHSIAHYVGDVDFCSTAWTRLCEIGRYPAYFRAIRRTHGCLAPDNCIVGSSDYRIASYPEDLELGQKAEQEYADDPLDGAYYEMGIFRISFFEHTWIQSYSPTISSRLFRHCEIPPPEPNPTHTAFVRHISTFCDRLASASNNMTRRSDLFLRNNNCHIYLSGGMLPLCTLYHDFWQSSFTEYAKATYSESTFDLFLIGTRPSAGVEYLTHTAKIVPTTRDSLAWHDSYGREGVTLYYTCHGTSVRLHTMTTDTEPLRYMTMITTKHHLPAARAFYDGQQLFVTPECLFAWSTRLCKGKLYLNHDDPDRSLKIVLKYAMRGFGFDNRSLSDEHVVLPGHVKKDLQAYSYRRYLPWYHPVYHPRMWENRFKKTTAAA